MEALSTGAGIGVVAANTAGTALFLADSIGILVGSVMVARSYSENFFNTFLSTPHRILTNAAQRVGNYFSKIFKKSNNKPNDSSNQVDVVALEKNMVNLLTRHFNNKREELRLKIEIAQETRDPEQIKNINTELTIIEEHSKGIFAKFEEEDIEGFCSAVKIYLQEIKLESKDKISFDLSKERVNHLFSNYGTSVSSKDLEAIAKGLEQIQNEVKKMPDLTPSNKL